MPKRGGGQCPRPAFYCGTAAGDGPPGPVKSHARGTGNPIRGGARRRTSPGKNTRTARPTGVWDATIFLKSPAGIRRAVSG